MYERGTPVCLRADFFVVGVRDLRLDMQGYLAHKKLPPPEQQRGALGLSLLQGPTRRQFVMSEVPLYPHHGAKPTPEDAEKGSHLICFHLRPSHVHSLYLCGRKLCYDLEL